MNGKIPPPADDRSPHSGAPPRGYEWREADGNDILATAAPAIMACVIANGG